MAAFDACGILVVCALLVLAYAPPAWGYVDPSVMTYTIQALMGVAVALAAVAGVAFRRMRRALADKLGIDENAHKVVEPVAHRLDSLTGRPVPNACDDVLPTKRARRAKQGVAPSPRLTWFRRWVFSFVACLFTLGTLLLITPVELMAANSADLVIGVDSAGWVMAVFALVVVFAASLLLSALRGKAFNLVFGLMVAIGLGFWVQAAFLNGGLPEADGTKVLWDEHLGSMVVSSLVWMALLGAITAFALLRPAFARVSLSAACLVLLVVQLVGMGSFVTASLQESYENGSTLAVTERGMLTVSPKNNVIVFVLDTTDTALVDRILQKEPDMLDQMEGFTWFHDATGSLIPTRYGIPFLLTGKMPEPGETFDEYYVRRYRDSSFVADIHDAGYTVGLYTDTIVNGAPYMRDYALNVTSVTPEQVMKSGMLDIPGTINAWCCCSLYCNLPWPLKPLYWYYTDWINNQMVNAWAHDEEDVPYETDDPAFFNKLMRQGLSATDAGEKGAFRMIHLLGSHRPYVMDSMGARIFDANGTVEEQTYGAFHIVGEYLQQLKRMNLYKDATIIITADHGYFGNSTQHASWVSSPVLMVKPAGVAEGALSVSDAQTGHEDYPATVLEAVGSPVYSNYGLTVWQAPDFGRVRTYCHLTHDPKTRIDYSLEEYQITGDVLDFSNWYRDGNAWVITPAD